MDQLEDNIIRAIQEVSLKEALQDEERKIQHRHKTIRLSILAIAAVLVIGVFIIAINGNDKKYSQMAEAYIEELDSSTVSRGEMDDIVSEYQQTIKQLRLHNIDSAKKTITLLYSDINKSDYTDDEKQQIILNANYVEALIYLSDNDFQKAEPLLIKVSQSDSKYAEKAKEILEKERR